MLLVDFHPAPETALCDGPQALLVVQTTRKNADSVLMSIPTVVAVAAASDWDVSSVQKAVQDMVAPGLTAARLGLHFYRRGLERYVSRLGVDQAKRLFLTAEKIDASEMKAIGFLTHLVAADALPASADQLATTLAGMAPLALLGMKKNLNRIARGALDPEDLRRDIERATASHDLQEGRTAWAEKREPRFSGQ
jgi:hypothetical protein